MQVIILAGGLGTRVRPYTFTIPKPLLPVGNRPLLDYIISHLSRFGATEIILALGYQAELIKAYCGGGERFGVPIRYVEEDRPLGTAGCISLCRPLLNLDEPCVLMNGDIVTKLDFDRLRAFHEEHGAHLTIGYIHHKYQSPFGVLQMDGDEITGIEEKPVYVHPASAGIYCLSGEAVRLVPDDTALTMPELAMRVRSGGGKVLGYEIREFWRALETRDHFEQLLNDEHTLASLSEGLADG